MVSSNISPLAPETVADLPVVDGVRLASAETGLKYKGRPDLMLAILDKATTIAGSLTKSLTRSAAVDWCAGNLAKGKARGILVNAGNANAFTGRAGEIAVRNTAGAVADVLDCELDEIFVASTGVIGEPLPVSPITARLQGMADTASGDGWRGAAEAILTTDTFVKVATVTAKIGSKTVTINGIAKGSGMIAPDMATMLVFLFTDANLPAKVLQKLLARSVDQSFNCITVDGDTSTSDTVLLCATGATGKRLSNLRSANDARLKGFARALDTITRDLAHQVVKDGEGAEKFISISVSGAKSDEAARKIGLAIANSPLVKTAIAGEDANWGRIVMAVGKSGQAADRDKLKIRIGGITVASKGQVDPRYNEADLVPHMQGRDIDIAVDVGVGKGSATVWTCDLTHRYIEINADYRS